MSIRTHNLLITALHDQKRTLTKDTCMLKESWYRNLLILVEMTVNCENHDLLVELIGTLCNISICPLTDDASWAEIISKYSLGTFTGTLLMPGMAQDDIILEVINLLRHICFDDECARLLCSSKVFPALAELWQKRTTEPLITAAVLSVFSRFLYFPSAREKILDETSKWYN